MNELETAILDCNCRYYHLDTIQLMESAGRGVAEEIEKRYGCNHKIAVFCGLGNNGGDGFVAARFLAQKNEITLYLAGKPDQIQTPEAQSNWGVLTHTAIRKEILSDLGITLPRYDIIVDALLGTGVSGELREPYKTLVKTLNSLPGKKVAVDVPTGYNTSTVFAADLTISMHYPKVEGCVTLTLGIPKEFEKLTGPGDVKFLKRRRKESHKGNNGRVLIVGGSSTYHGAPVYAGLAASKLVDLVIIACPQSAASTIKGVTPDFIVHSLSADYLTPEDIPLIQELAASCDSILLGPGLGREEETQETCRDLLSCINNTTVIDADGLKALKNHPPLLKTRIITPHRGEFAMLFGTQEVEEAALRHHCSIVQKGETDVISTGEKTKLNLTGNAGMTTGGTGDILAGLITGFAAVNDPFQSCCAAAFVNGLAGDLCYQEYGFYYTASDVVKALQGALMWCDAF